MESPQGIIAAFILGLFSTVHCLGMCGGIIGALSLSLPERVRLHRGRLLSFVTTYNIGRIISYSFAGMIVGYLGARSRRLHRHVRWTIDPQTHRRRDDDRNRPVSGRLAAAIVKSRTYRQTLVEITGADRAQTGSGQQFAQSHAVRPDLGLVALRNGLLSFWSGR